MARKLAAAAAAGVIGGALLLAGGAQAQVGVLPVSPWTTMDTGAGGVRLVPSAHSAIVNPTTAEATWATGEPASALGTSIETANIGVSAPLGTEVSVDYELLGGADPAAGSVRLFIYFGSGADTFNEAPAQFVAAPDDGSTSGTLSFVTNQSGTIGTAGVVYDTSNGGVAGAVRFSNLRIGEDKVLFSAPEPTTGPPEDPGAGDGGGGDGDGDDGEGGDKPGLPTTSGLTGLPLLLGASGLLLAAGSVALLVTRRRKLL